MDARVSPPPQRLSLWPTPGQELLLNAALCADADVVGAFQAWRAVTDLDGYVDWGTYRLLPLVYDRLRALGADDPVTPRLKGVYRRAWCETQALFDDAAPFVAALEAAGVDTMMLKGAPLALGYYRTPAARPMRDIDIVVRRRDARRAIDVAKSLGWVPSPDLSEDQMDYMHSLDLRQPDGGEIDLHWHCLYDAMSEAADAWFWEDARPLDFKGVRTRQPAPAAMLAHVMLHGLRADADPPIRWISDAAVLIRGAGTDLDWDGFLSFARAHKFTSRLSLGLEYLAESHGVCAPEAVRRALKAKPASFAERLENSVYLDAGPGSNWFAQRWSRVAHYGRFFRTRPAMSALWGGLDYVRVGWRLQRRRQIPLEAFRRAGRMLRRKAR